MKKYFFSVILIMFCFIFKTVNVFAAISIIIPSGAWTNKTVQVEVSGSSDFSGIQKYQTNIDGGGWIDYNSGSLPTISTEGNHSILARAIDNANNISSNASATINVDKTLPTASNVLSVSGNYVSNTSFIVRVTGVTDSLSGINKVCFPTWTDYNGQDDINPDWPNGTIGTNLGGGTWEFTVRKSDHKNENGNYITHVYVYDNAGNSSYAGTANVIVDNIAPSSPGITCNTNWTTAAYVPVTLSATDAESGVSKIEYSLSGSSSQNWTTYSGQFNIVNEGITNISARVTDNAGNISTTSTSVVKIDRSIPIYGEVKLESITPARFKVTINNVNDALSGLNKVIFKVWSTENGQDDIKDYVGIFNGNTCEYTIDKSELGEYNVQAYIYDNAGNVAISEVKRLSVNQIPLAVVKSPSSGTGFTADKPPYITAQIIDLDGDNVGVDLQYFNGSSWETIKSTSATTNQTVTLYVKDKIWKRVSYNTDVKLRLQIYDGYAVNYSSEIIVKKVNSAPEIKINSPVNSQYMTSGYLEFDVSVFDADSELFPVIDTNNDFDIIGNGVFICNNGEYTYDYSQNVTWSYHGINIDVDTEGTYTLSFEAFISEDADIEKIGTTFIANMEYGLTPTFNYDNTKLGTWQTFTYTGNPTDTSVRFNLYPSTSSIPVKQGTLKFRNISFSKNDLTLKLYTDTANVANSGVFIDTTTGNERIKFVSYTYLPVGDNNIIGTIKDSGGNIVQTNCTIKVPEEVSLYTGNTNKTFYIANFDLAKNNVYYNRLNSKLNNEIYIINVLGENAAVNREFVNGIVGIQDVSGQKQFMQQNLIDVINGMSPIGMFSGSTGTNVTTGNVTNPITSNSVEAVILSTSNNAAVYSDPLSLNMNTSYTIEFDYWSDVDNNSFAVMVNPGIFTEDLTANASLQHYIKTISSSDINMATSDLGFSKTVDFIEGNIYITNLKLYRSDEKRRRLFDTDGIKVDSIVEWILSSMGGTDKFSSFAEVSTDLTIQNIIFTDEEEDYVSINPDRGLNRRFKVTHNPGYYDVADNEISNNGVWYSEGSFNMFDGNSVKRNGENLTLTFNKAGKYVINVLEDDKVSNNYGIDFSKSSNLSNYTLFVHRPPVAVINYEPISSDTVKLINQSYDLDFFKRTDKGISSALWEYRIVDYSDNVIQEWQPIPDINNLKLNQEYRTYVRLTVFDFGATIADDNDGILKNTTIKVFDNIGTPPVADFMIKVGTTLENSVPSEYIVYKGTQLTGGEILAETVQLDDSYIQWNDFFATSGTQTKSWTVDQSSFNFEIRTDVSSTTTLSVKNRFGLTSSATKTAVAKRVDLINNLDLNSDGVTDINFDGGSKQHFIFVLSSLDGDQNWSNLDIRIYSEDLKIYNVSLENSISNVFEADIDIPYTDSDFCTYKASIYSKRTGELLQTNSYSVEVNNLAITDVDIQGYWNHWRGQIDIFGKQMPNEPHRFMSLEKVRVIVNTIGNADKIIIRFSPELEAMQYIDPNGNVYNYADKVGYEVNFPLDSTIYLDSTNRENSIQWEYILPLALSTKDWNDNIISSPYWVEITAFKGTKTVSEIIYVELTGNTYDQIYIQPN